MQLNPLSYAKIGTMSGPRRNPAAPPLYQKTGNLIVPNWPNNGTIFGLPNAPMVCDPRRMRRASVYPYTITEPPGVNVHALRAEADLSMRELAERCVPPLSHTVIKRIEYNQGFTQDTLERLAVALSKVLHRKITVADLFYPPEVAGWLGEYKSLPPEARARIDEMVHDTHAAYVYRKRTPS